MNVRRFSARTAREALALVREALGDDAVVLSTKPNADGVEVLAMLPEGVQQAEAAAAPAVLRAPQAGGPRPRTLAERIASRGEHRSEPRGDARGGDGRGGDARARGADAPAAPPQPAPTSMAARGAALVAALASRGIAAGAQAAGGLADRSPGRASASSSRAAVHPPPPGGCRCGGAGGGRRGHGLCAVPRQAPGAGAAGAEPGRR